MREILTDEICMEKPNSAALGAFNSSLSVAVNVNNMNTFKDFKSMTNKQNSIIDKISKKLNSFQKSPGGGVSDSIRNTPEYKKVKNEFDKEFKTLQDLNAKGVKKYKKELYNERSNRR